MLPSNASSAHVFCGVTVGWGSIVGVYSIVTDRAGMLSQALRFYCELQAQMENQKQVSYQVCAILGCIPFAAISAQHSRHLITFWTLKNCKVKPLRLPCGVRSQHRTVPQNMRDSLLLPWYFVNAQKIMRMVALIIFIIIVIYCNSSSRWDGDSKQICNLFTSANQRTNNNNNTARNPSLGSGGNWHRI